jgi:hypothetical protein
MSRFVGSGKKLMSFLVPKPNVPKTELGKKTRDLKLAIQKSKAGKAKLDQTIFELKNNKDFTFKSTNKKSESNTEAYKRITGENNKVIKNMLNKATEKKADGGRIGRKFGGGTDLRDIPAGKKYAGLKKLPKEVRNKMKFKKNGGKI